MTESMKPQAPKPLGICQKCLDAMTTETGPIDGDCIALPRGVLLIGVYCVHHRTSATTFANIDSRDRTRWHMVSPISREDFLAMLRLSAERGEALAAEAASNELLSRVQGGEDRPH